MKTGTSTGTVYTSPRRKQAKARREAREEREWAARSGPVTVTYREILPNDHEILPNRRVGEDASDCSALVSPQPAAPPQQTDRAAR